MRNKSNNLLHILLLQYSENTRFVGKLTKTTDCATGFSNIIICYLLSVAGKCTKTLMLFHLCTFVKQRLEYYVPVRPRESNWHFFPFGLLEGMPSGFGKDEQ